MSPLWLWLACASGPADPRPAIAAGFVEGRPVRLDPADALRKGRHFEACVGLKQRLRTAPDEADWPRLLTVAARDPACLPAAESEQLAAWGRGRAEWRDAVGEWDAAAGRPVEVATLGPAARLRVLLRGSDQAALVAAAGEVLAHEPGDPFACAVVVQDAIERGELLEALTHCEGVQDSGLARLRAQALDEAGRHAEAVRAYDAAGFTLHGAAILLQELPERDAEALRRLEEPVPPAAIHRAWRAVLRGEPIPLQGLDDSPEATLIRALAGVPSAVAALPGLDTLEARVLHARLTHAPAELEADLAAAPTSDVLLRAELGIRLEAGLDLEPARQRLQALDPDHVRLGGVAGRREAPWAAIVPWSWTLLRERAALLPSTAEDDVGVAWRAAAALDERAREQRLADLQADYPELRGLARLRAGGTLLDGPP